MAESIPRIPELFSQFNGTRFKQAEMFDRIYNGQLLVIKAKSSTFSGRIVFQSTKKPGLKRASFSQIQRRRQFVILNDRNFLS